MNGWWIYRAYCVACDKKVPVFIGPGYSQHSCEKCGSDLDPNFTVQTWFVAR